MDDFNKDSKDYNSEKPIEVEATPVSDETPEQEEQSVPAANESSPSSVESTPLSTNEEQASPSYRPQANTQPQTPFNTAQKPYYYEPPKVNQTEYQNPIYTRPPVNSDNTPYTPSPSFSPEPPKKQKKKRKGTAVIAVMLAICVAIAAFGIIGANLEKSDSDGEPAITQKTDSAQATVKSSKDAETENSDGSLTAAGVYKKVVNSCVGISVYSTQTTSDDFYSYFYGNQNSGSQNQSGKETLSGEGSGVLMLEDKSKGLTYVMTCAHVIADGSKFTVTLNDKTEYDATLVGIDSQSDIGVLSINQTGLSIAEFGSSDDIDVGEDCIAIGNPGGMEYANSMTKGIVSALNRPVSSSIGYDNECIQIDAAINPGNSGGPLFNMQGQVIGINSSKIAQTEYEGMGFAVPSNTAVANANSIIANGYVSGRAKIGIQYSPITNYQNASAILSSLEQKGYEDAQGVMVVDTVDSESDLSSKGIQKYDMIVAVNGTTMTSTDIMTSVLAKSKPGETIKLTFARVNGNELEFFDIECKLIESKE